MRKKIHGEKAHFIRGSLNKEHQIDVLNVRSKMQMDN